MSVHDPENFNAHVRKGRCFETLITRPAVQNFKKGWTFKTFGALKCWVTILRGIRDQRHPFSVPSHVWSSEVIEYRTIMRDCEFHCRFGARKCTESPCFTFGRSKRNLAWCERLKIHQPTIHHNEVTLCSQLHYTCVHEIAKQKGASLIIPTQEYYE